MKKFVRGLMLVLNVLFALLLVMAKFTTWLTPISWFGVFIYTLGLAFPVLLILNLLFLLHWLYRLKWFTFISIIAILICYPEVKNTIPIQFKAVKMVTPGSVKVTTSNIGGFIHGDYDYYGTINSAFNFFNDVYSDVICMQELSLSRARHTRFTIDSLMRRMEKLPFSHMVFLKENKYRSTSGNAIFSKYPIVGKGEIKFKESTNNIVIYADIRVKDQTVRVYSVHFESNRLKPLNKKMYDKVTHGDTEVLKQEIKFLSKAMRRAARSRAYQVQTVQQHIETCPYPVIICGDFNDTPVTYTYKYLRKKRKDAFVENGNGLGITYKGRYPALRIDYFLYNPALRAVGYEKHKEQIYSDHYPISCSFELPAKN